MSNAEIDCYAEEFLKDWQPSVLKNPQPVDIEKFVEIYLDLALDYTYLSHCGLILGRMVFQDTERVPIYLPEEKCADYLNVKRGTMMIDNIVLEDRKEYRLRSTIGHECGHWVFHSDYYTHAIRPDRQTSMTIPGITGCKITDIEGRSEAAGKRKLVTDTDWLEHQAKYFSAAILMPKTPFITATMDLIHNCCVDEKELAISLSNIFQVSSASVGIRLSQLGLPGLETETWNTNHLTCSSSQALCG